ncbi:hypothetical protein OSB04_021723 [Centaurea solstitialis]|uniref:Uncharacterized protein n=1 Tax=Centaurea solstitialis TaxID=347529 RepID=A0AA38SUQ2_9ASTR|nr:hypothetical protein OSB04_021723 [Centaurea solstitialis]
MGRSPCCDKTGLKKGPWTQEEDVKLKQYIRMHGPGNWRTLPKKAGLQRCGKSCRLRWTNYLRPDIKRGRFSFEEEETIIQLHSVLGNKWSAIASRLPGRTDNEIKNYWNTNIRKKLLQNGIDPVTHAPRLDFMDLSSMLNSAQFNLSNLLNLQTLVNPHVLKLATLLASSSSNQVNHFNQQIQTTPSSFSSTPLLDNSNLMGAKDRQYFPELLVNMNGQSSQENLIPSCLTTDNSVALPSYNSQFTTQSENLSFQPSNIGDEIATSQDFNYDSILSIPTISSTSTTHKTRSVEHFSSLFIFHFFNPWWRWWWGLGGNGDGGGGGVGLDGDGACLVDDGGGGGSHDDGLDGDGGGGGCLVDGDGGGSHSGGGDGLEGDDGGLGGDGGGLDGDGSGLGVGGLGCNGGGLGVDGDGVGGLGCNGGGDIGVAMAKMGVAMVTVTVVAAVGRWWQWWWEGGCGGGGGAATLVATT